MNLMNYFHLGVIGCIGTLYSSRFTVIAFHSIIVFAEVCSGKKEVWLDIVS